MPSAVEARDAWNGGAVQRKRSARGARLHERGGSGAVRARREMNRGPPGNGGAMQRKRAASHKRGGSGAVRGAAQCTRRVMKRGWGGEQGRCAAKRRIQ